MKMLKLSFLLGIGLLFAACGERPFYTETHSFKNNTFTQQDTAKFIVEVNDTLTPYTTSLFLRTTTDYLYSNLWIYVDIIAPDNVKSKTAYPIKITRADGSWIGKKSGTIVESKLIFGASKFPLTGKYTYIITQAVNQEEINQVLDLGLTISQKTNK